MTANGHIFLKDVGASKPVVLSEIDSKSASDSFLPPVHVGGIQHVLVLVYIYIYLYFLDREKV